MKPLFCLLSAVPLCFSCVDQGGSEIDYIIFNQTDKHVIILGFDKRMDPNLVGIVDPGDNGIADPIHIDPNSKYKVTRYTGINYNGLTFYSVIADSVRVIFNNEKVLILTLESTFKQGQTIFQGDPAGDHKYQHIITEEDYDSAVECDKDCE